MNQKRILAACLAVVMLVLVCPTGWTSAGVSNEYEYAMSDGKIEIIKYIGSLDDVVVPSMIGGFPVVAIRARAFFGNTFLRSVVISDGITSIGHNAFAYCERLERIEIGGYVTSIAEEAIYDCPMLNEIVVADSNSFYTDEGNCLIEKSTGRLLSGCNMSVIPDSVKSIRAYAFLNCKALTSVEIPAGVTWFEEGVFCGCSALERMTLPEGLTRIGACGFYGCSALTELVLPASVQALEDGAFMGCSALSKINVPSGVTGIRAETFYGCASLAEVCLPESITSIGERAFYGCRALTEITIPNAVKHLGKASFMFCSALERVTFLQAPESIGDSAFNYCNALREIRIPNGVTTIGEMAFSSCGSLIGAVIPASVETVGKGAFAGSKKLKDIYCMAEEQPPGWSAEWLSVCGAAVHWGATEDDIVICGHEELRLEKKDETCDESGYVRWVCASCGFISSQIDYEPLGHNWVQETAEPTCVEDGFVKTRCIVCDAEQDTIVLPAEGHLFAVGWCVQCGVASDGACGLIFYVNTKNQAVITGFYGEATELVLPAVLADCPVTSIDRSAFYGCETLTEVVIPESVTSIGANAFAGCRQLCEVVLPNSVTTIGSGAFSSCSSLEYLDLPDAITRIESDLFSYCTSLVEISLPYGVTSIGEYAFYYCKSMVFAEIPDSVTTIESNAFGCCHAMKSILLPASVTEIEDRAFAFCSALTDVYCEASEQPAEWDAEWLGPYCTPTVHFGVCMHRNWEERVEEATCTENGCKETLCASCGVVLFEEPLPPLGHDGADGTCTVCGGVLFVCGDANGDGTVDGKDVTRLLRYLANYDPVTDESTVEGTEGADVNGDGAVDGKDATRLLRYLANYDPETGTSSVTLGK